MGTYEHLVHAALQQKYKKKINRKTRGGIRHLRGKATDRVVTYIIKDYGGNT